MTKLAKDDELMRRISGALDAEGGLDADPALRAQLDADPEALSYAQDLVRIDEVLKGFGAEVREPDWEAMASAIEARLDDPLPPLEVDAPPRFLDEAEVNAEPGAGGPVDVSPADVSQVHVSQKVPVDPPTERTAEVVDLAARRTRRNAVLAWMSGLAAAAAIAIGVSSGAVMTFDAAAPEAAPLAEAVEDKMSAESAVAPPAPERGRAHEGAAMGAAREAAIAEPEPEPSAAAPAAGGVNERRAARRRRVVRVAPAPAQRGRSVARRQDSDAPSVELGDFEAHRGSGGGHPSGSSSTGGGGLGVSEAERGPHRGTPASPPSRTRARTSGPNLTAARATLRSAEPAVQRCLAAGAAAHVGLRVAAGGEIVGVDVRPPYGEADGRCIADALRPVRLAPHREPYTLRHIFRPSAESAAAAEP